MNAVSHLYIGSIRTQGRSGVFHRSVSMSCKMIFLSLLLRHLQTIEQIYGYLVGAVERCAAGVPFFLRESGTICNWREQILHVHSSSCTDGT